ncbi:MAG: hypothetical protein JNK07_16970 [Alphaproteobacteria bacterium]|nr:hypothetical protein [Alphaproteobacteria bacterium]
MKLIPSAFAAAALTALALTACSQQESASAPPPASEEVATAEPAPPDAPAAPVSTPAPAPVVAAPEPPSIDDIAPGAGIPGDSGSVGSAMPPAAAGDPPPPVPAPAPAAAPPGSSPPASANGYGAPKNGHSGSKVLSYFQKARTKIDPNRAFGFVLMTKVAVSDDDKRTQKTFCTTLLATMDFMTPGAVASSAPAEVLATYWPVVGSRESYEIKQAFSERNCDDLIAWYDFTLARTLASKAGVAEMSGPLLITWPSMGADGRTARDPLIVDFSKANQERATKALQYWFRQVKSRPDLWTNRIREGTIRAELADAVNDTAGVLLTVMAGKWDSLTVVASAEASP